MTLEQKLNNIHYATEEELKNAIESKYQKLEAKPVQPNERHIRPSISPVVYRNYINSTGSDVQITGGMVDDIQYYYVDNTCEVFENFANKVQQSKTNSIEELLKYVSSTIFEYIGGIEVDGNINDRLSHLQEGENSKLSSFKGSKNAWCMERAVMAHQIFSMLGIESELVISPIWLDEKKKKDGTMKTEQHAFNLIRHKGKTYLFDSTLIDFSKSFDEQTSIVEVLPSDVFDTLEDIPTRIFKGKNGQERKCVYNPKNNQPYIIGESSSAIESKTE